MSIFITNPGVGALIIEAGRQRILVDAYNTIGVPPEPKPGDIMLFTHDDADHFAPDILPDLRQLDVIIAGPPTVLTAILRNGKADLRQILDLYSNRFSQPLTTDLLGVQCTCYHTEHFNEWDPLHNSYLITIEDRRIYITGDSILTPEILDRLGPIDIVVVNLVDGPYLKGLAGQEEATARLVSYLRMLEDRVEVRRVIPVHMISFPWAVGAEAMYEAVRDAGLAKVTVPQSSTDRLEIVL